MVNERTKKLHEISKLKLALNKIIPIGTDLAVILIALAELSKEIALLLYEENEDD